MTHCHISTSLGSDVYDVMHELPIGQERPTDHMIGVCLPRKISHKPLRTFDLCSRDLHVLRAQRIMKLPTNQRGQS